MPPSRSSIAPSDVDSLALNELESLMKEFPDWKEQYPDIYHQLNPPRYSKNKAVAGAPLRYDGELRVQKRQQTVPETDYGATFKKHPTRPRSSKKPPPSPRDPNPPPMVFDTNQRSEFKPKRLDGGRVKPIKKEDNYVPPSEPFDGTSKYAIDYPPKFVLPEINNVPEKVVRGSMRRSDGTFDGRTTNKEHFKEWNGQPSIPFGELPVFTGSLLYPDQSRDLETTTMRTFRGKKGEKPAMITRSAGNLRLEGDHEFTTVNRTTYKGEEGMKADIVIHKPEFVVKKRGQIAGKTQTMQDYGGYNGKMPRPAQPIAPPQPTVDLRFDNSRSMETEQRKEFQGVDVKKHPMPKSCKKEPDTYTAPAEKFETVTSQKRDFQPIDMSENYVAPVKNPHARSRDKAGLPKLDGTTTNNQFFKNWDVQPRIRYEDIYEANMFARRDAYVPSKEKFNIVSTTRETYQGKYAPVPKSLKPEEKSVESTGKHDFSTVYKVEFHQPSDAKKLDKRQAATLLKELRKKKKSMKSVSNSKVPVHA